MVEARGYESGRVGKVELLVRLLNPECFRWQGGMRGLCASRDANDVCRSTKPQGTYGGFF